VLAVEGIFCPDGDAVALSGRVDPGHFRAVSGRCSENVLARPFRADERAAGGFHDGVESFPCGKKCVEFLDGERVLFHLLRMGGVELGELLLADVGEVFAAVRLLDAEGRRKCGRLGGVGDGGSVADCI